MQKETYKGKKILITGGTGTIGRQLVQRLLKDEPSVIRIFSRDEHKQYEMNIDFQAHSNQLRFLIGDVRDQQRLMRAMEDIDYVFHLAAMKHVPSCEYNPFEAVQTNVIGTQNVIQAALENGVKKVLFTSTDKAISPTNTYGATKLTAERLISASEYQKGSKSTIFSSVRFGNVMGSRGSVIPLFKKQILENGEITITDPEMLRYMMTPSQAIELILQANEDAQGGEVFVLKMPVVRIGDLAEALIKVFLEKSGIKTKVEVKRIGLRPGEKMFEELMTEDERLNALETEQMYIIPSLSKNKNQTLSNKIIKPNELPIAKNVIIDWLISENLI
ncbi:UDP-N-acetylglucosamine 4,6-dehydratase family protein [Paenibacillus sp. Aloe-11]|uniref:UDP-N-acetylglucosamine 4,6-dehydratase family protein n=1 Tax=Paenibacillus sp. Aloe-11 TaxID=1050222 RepID=UPI00024EFE24|nr:UDP-N-acetylglucosamine 4,6-dehydratase family protein [Paenibacillus sp. Aloe-11]EHS55361.1 polysaccharide biosynthesis protein CapD [Paenibacillus sp. Aloe-11]